MEADELYDNSSQTHQEHHVSVTFYKWQFAATLAWWILIKATTEKHWDEITYGSVLTRPSWLSAKFLLQLQTPTKRRWICGASLVAMAVPPLIPIIWPRQQSSIAMFLLRLLVACMVSLYHLVESSLTRRHGEYPLLYNVWAMCLPWSEYAHAASWGIAIHFVFSTGLAKLVIGGFGGWTSPATLKFYFNLFYHRKINMQRPFWPSWNRWVCQRDWATRFMALSTIFLECFLVPGTLLLPPHQRYVARWAMIPFHLGIFLIMSRMVGLGFATTIPNYLIGFSSRAVVGTGPWLCAVAVAFLPTILSLGVLGHLLPEDWPSCPFKLYMWSGDQAQVLAETLITGETRVVLATADISPHNIVGLSVVPDGAVEPAQVMEGKDDTMQVDNKNNQAVYDCFRRAIDLTGLNTELADAVPKSGNTKKEWDVNRFVTTLQQFLASKKRLFETQSGRPLVKAFFVRIDSKGNVSKVLSAG